MADRKAAKQALEQAFTSLTCALTGPHTDEQIMQHVEFIERKMVEARGYLDGHLVAPPFTPRGRVS